MTILRCADCLLRLDALVSGELTGEPRREADLHLGSCDRCARAHRELTATVELLHHAAVEPLPDGFEAALHRRLVAEGPPPRPVARRAGGWLRALLAGRTLVGLGGAAVGAAAMALLLAARSPVAVAPPIAPPVALAAVGPVAPSFRVPAMRLAVVRIDFVAEEAIDDVQFAVTLPEGLRFVSGGRELPDRAIRWSGKLAPGSNAIPIAVRGARAGRYTVEATMIGAGGEVVTQQVVLEVTA